MKVPIIKALKEGKPILGRTFALHCKANTNQDVSYLWYKDGKVITSNHKNVLALSNTTELDSGKYSCSTQNSLGSKRSNDFTLDLYGNFHPNYIA